MNNIDSSRSSSSSSSSTSVLLFLSFIISLLFFSVLPSLSFLPKVYGQTKINNHINQFDTSLSSSVSRDELHLQLSSKAFYNNQGSPRPRLEIEDLILPEDCAGRSIYDDDFYNYLLYRSKDEQFFDEKNVYRVQNYTDHVLVSLSVKDIALDEVLFTTNPFKPLHFRLGDNYIIDLINLGMLGMCEGGTRSIISPPNQDYGYDKNEVKTAPYFPALTTSNVDDSHSLQFIVTLHNVTMEEDYQIFKHLDDRNVSAVMDMIGQGKGVNAIDEFGSSTLMRATIERNELVVAGLMNCRKPNVWINSCKPTGYTALIYSVSQRTPALLKAFLRRGADPNLQILEGGSQGYTALHFAIKLEHYDHASILLSYGANPTIKGLDGTSALDLVMSAEMVKKQKEKWLNLINDAVYLWNKKEMDELRKELEETEQEQGSSLSIKEEIEKEMQATMNNNEILKQPKKMVFGEL